MLAIDEKWFDMRIVNFAIQEMKLLNHIHNPYKKLQILIKVFNSL